MPGEASRTGVSRHLPNRETIGLARLAMIVFHGDGFFGF